MRSEKEIKDKIWELIATQGTIDIHDVHGMFDIQADIDLLEWVLGRDVLERTS